MKWKPRKYQKQGLKRMLEDEATLLFWDPGLGKTSTTLACASKLIDDGLIGEGPKGQSMSVLVSAPLRVAQAVWAQEAQKWDDFADLNVQLVWDSVKRRKEERADTPADVYVINHESLAWLLQHWQGWVPDMLVIDESVKFKNPSSVRFQALKKVLPFTKRRYLLTATPAPNSLEDLWAQAFIADGGKALGRYVTHFRRRWFVDVGYGYPDWQPVQGAEQDIYEALAPICSRLQLDEHLDLPSLTINDLPVPLPPSALSLYRDFERKLTARMDDGEITAVHAASATMKLRQIANGTVYLTEDGQPSKGTEIVHKAKVLATTDLLEEIAGPVLIVYEFLPDVEGIREAVLAARPKATIKKIGKGGARTAKQILDVVDWWNGGADGDGVLILHPDSGGEGLNLQEGGTHVIQYGLTWRLDGHQQTIGRVWRQGQTRPVIVHRLVAQDTVDLDVVRTLQFKDATQSALLASLKERTS